MRPFGASEMTEERTQVCASFVNADETTLFRILVFVTHAFYTIFSTQIETYHALTPKKNQIMYLSPTEQTNLLRNSRRNKKWQNRTELELQWLK